MIYTLNDVISDYLTYLIYDKHEEPTVFHVRLIQYCLENMKTASFILYSATHYVDTNYVPSYPYKKPFNYHFTWTPDFNDPVYFEYMKRKRLRQFLDDMGESERLFGEHTGGYP